MDQVEGTVGQHVEDYLAVVGKMAVLLGVAEGERLDWKSFLADMLQDLDAGTQGHDYVVAPVLEAVGAWLEEPVAVGVVSEVL